MAQPALRVWPPLSPGVHLRRPASELPFPLGEPGVRLHSRARTALVEGLLSLGLGSGDRVLTPAWHHGSEVEAIRSTGADCTFYDVGPDLAPREEELDQLVTPEVRALHLTHYLGLPQDVQRWRAWCDARDLLLVEDAAQSWLGSHHGAPLGSHGDVAVWCLYKIVGLPDGAAVRCRAPLGDVGPAARMAPAALRRHAAWVFQFVPGPRTAPADGYDREADMRVGDPHGMSAASRRLLPLVVDPQSVQEIVNRRRENFLAWQDALGRWTPPHGRALPDGAAPMAFPVMVADKPATLAALRDVGVHALDLWREPHPELQPDRFPTAAWLRRHVIGLPVHQEMPRGRFRAAVSEVERVVSRAAPPSGASG